MKLPERSFAALNGQLLQHGGGSARTQHLSWGSSWRPFHLEKWPGAAKENANCCRQGYKRKRNKEKNTSKQQLHTY